VGVKAFFVGKIKKILFFFFIFDAKRLNISEMSMQDYFFSILTTKKWRQVAIIACVSFLASVGTWMSGQYQVGRLDGLIEEFSRPVEDYAASYADTKEASLERDLMEACKQVQIGTWLQTTDSIRFKDPISGNRFLVQLDPEKSYMDLNGKELSTCMTDEIENKQFDIRSLTNSWSVILMILTLLLGGWAWYAWRYRLEESKSQLVEDASLSESNSSSPTTATPDNLKSE
jgi:hypothetical protein